jgi:hypothetical protein
MSLLQELHLCNWMTIKTLSSGLFPNKDYLMYNQCKKTGESNTLAIQQSIMEIKITTKNQDFHVVLVKRGNFNERQSTIKALERGSSMLFL